MAEPIRVLVVEDSPEDAELIVHELRRDDFAPAWSRVETAAGFLAALANPPDVILADFTLPRFSGLEALNLLKGRGLDVPFIVVTGDVREDAAVSCMKAGASDYLLKDRLARLGPAVRQALEQQKVRAGRAEAERRFRGIFDAANAFFGLLRPDGTVLEANRSALDFAGVAREAVLGFLFWETPWWGASPALQAQVRDAVGRAAAGEVVRFETEVLGAAGRNIAVDFSITPIRDDEGRVVLLVPEGFDITDRKRAEDELRGHRRHLEQLVEERTADLRESERRARLLRDVAEAANAARSPEEVLRTVVRSVSEHHGWKAGHAFVFDPSLGRLVDAGPWELRGDESLLRFVEDSEERSLGRGEGLAGKVLSTNQPACAEIGRGDPASPRVEAARRAGIRGACAFPVKVRGRVAAVLEFFTEHDPAADGAVLSLMEQVSAQVGIAVERNQAEAEYTKLLLAVRQSPASVVITDRDGRIEYVNPAFSLASGYSAEEALGATPRILKSGAHPQAFYEELWRTISAGESWRGELCNRRKNGEFYWESVSISPVRGDSGAVTHFVAVKLDITGRKQAEQQLEQAKDAAEAANRAKSAFLASMSHEIRTPMNAILGFSQLLAGDPELTARQKEQLHVISRSGEHLLALINDVLEMSKIEAGRATLHVTEVDLHTLFDDLEAMFRLRAEGKGLAFGVERPEDVPRFVRVDEGKLRQILVNLIGNAAKFTASGSILVRVRSKAGAGPTLLLVEVEDTGPGIGEEDLRRLFQQFEQTRTGRDAGSGTGLGLAISRGFARLMGGDLRVTSRLGVGSVFSLAVPVVPCEESAVPGRGAQPRPVAFAPGEPSHRVLVVDDLPENRAILSGMLERVGFEVRTADDGEQGVDAFSSWKPEVVLMDLRMPVMDGYEAIRRIRRSEPGTRVPILAVTASAFDEDRRLVEEAGGDGFIGKPFQEADLLEKVGRCVGARYVYAEPRPETPGGRSGTNSGPIRVSPFTNVPPALRERLREAVVRADLDDVQKLADEMEGAFAEEAQLVRSLAETFEYERLLAWLSAGTGDG